MSILKELRSRGIRLNKRRGQCLLMDMNTERRILDSAELTRDDLVIDIGTGPAHLVPLILEQCKHYLGIELDAGMFDFAQSKLGDCDACTLLHADILSGKNTLNPEVMTAIRDCIDTIKPRYVKIVANLPYKVATPVILNFLKQTRIRIDMMVVLIQKEVAMKLTAKPNTDPFGAVSILAQSYAKLRMLFDVPRTCFFPSPGVESSVVRLYPRVPDEREYSEEEQERFNMFVKKLFTLSRKKIVNAIDGSHVTKLSRAEIHTRIMESEINPELHVSQLYPHEIKDVYARMFLGEEIS